MIEYIKMGAALFIAKFLVGLALLVGLLVICVVYALWIGLKQSHCKHRRKYENRACHYVCYRCSKDLGFVGSYKEMQ
jgi:hypothetical protein